MSNQAYLDGFMWKCAQMGVDPEALLGAVAPVPSPTTPFLNQASGNGKAPKKPAKQPPAGKPADKPKGEAVKPPEKETADE
jgi:hypothetical protein